MVSFLHKISAKWNLQVRLWLLCFVVFQISIITVSASPVNSGFDPHSPISETYVQSEIANTAWEKVGLRRVLSKSEVGSEYEVLADESSIAARGSGNAFRYVSQGEIGAIKNTGLVRGGRAGETYFTKDLYKSGLKAQQRLSLGSTPTHRIEFQILNRPTLLRNGTKVTPIPGQPGLGSEFMTFDPVRIRLINVQPLR